MIVKLNNSTVILQSPEAKLLYNNDELEIIHLTIKKDETLSKHINQHEVTFFVLQGKGNISINNETYFLEKDELISVKAKLEREWINTGEEDLRILVFKNKFKNE